MANPDVKFTELLKNPMRYQGDVFIWGGVIVETIIEKQGTLLEIYQTHLDRLGQPRHLDRSEGRFMAYYDGFLDDQIWSKGRQITVAGVLEGVKIKKLGEIDYHYPFLRVREIHLWEKLYTYRNPYPWGPGAGPWSWGGWGWWGPYPYWVQRGYVHTPFYPY